MHSNRPYRYIALAIMLAAPASACSQGTNEGFPFMLSGGVSGSATPAEAEAMILFLPDDPNGNAIYKLGGGTSMGGAFSVSMDQQPPPAAYADDSGLAVAWVALYEPGYTLPDGPITQAQIDPIMGVSARFALIWKANEGSGTAKFPWAASFPTGLSCGVCADGSPDLYEPVPCADFEIDAYNDGSVHEWCNWVSQ